MLQPVPSISVPIVAIVNDTGELYRLSKIRRVVAGILTFYKVLAAVSHIYPNNSC